MKKFRFFYHYNKIASRKAGKPLITLHYKGVCHLVHDLWVNVVTNSKINKTQPFFVMQGWANEIIIDDFGAVIN